MERIFVDSSAWVALFSDTDQNHKKACDIYDNLKEVKAVLHTSDYVFDETVTFILQRRGHRLAIVAGDALLSSGLVSIAHIIDETLQTAWDLFRKYDDKKLSFTDITSFTLSREMAINKIFTFDSDFKKIGMETVGI